MGASKRKATGAKKSGQKKATVAKRKATGAKKTAAKKTTVAKRKATGAKKTAAKKERQSPSARPPGPRRPAKKRAPAAKKTATKGPPWRSGRPARPRSRHEAPTVAKKAAKKRS